MASIILAVKRKLSSFLPLASNPEAIPIEAKDSIPVEEGRFQKRRRLELDLGGTNTPLLRSTSALSCHHTDSSPWEHHQNRTQPVSPVKFQLPDEDNAPLSREKAVGTQDIGDDVANDSIVNNNADSSALLRMIPSDVIAQCLSYIPTTSDRFSLQTTCTLFRDLSNADEILAHLDVGGDWTSLGTDFQQSRPGNFNGEAEGGGYLADDDDVLGEQFENDPDQNLETGLVDENGAISVSSGGWAFQGFRGVLTESDTSYTACRKLIKYAAAGNMQAIYMLGMILCYCHENITEGVSLLRLAIRQGHLRSMYALALILRDSSRSESDRCFEIAASLGFTPAWQEKLTATEMRAKFGDLDASKLLQYLDPPGLNRLLGRHYLECQQVRKHQTSHCWNPLCGRWAYKATLSRRQQRRENNAIVQNDTTTSDGSEDTPASTSLINRKVFSILHLLPDSSAESSCSTEHNTPLGEIRHLLENQTEASENVLKVSRMKMCSSCRRAKYCSKLCQVYDWRSGRHKTECQFL